MQYLTGVLLFGIIIVIPHNNSYIPQLFGMYSSVSSCEVSRIPQNPTKKSGVEVGPVDQCCSAIEQIPLVKYNNWLLHSCRHIPLQLSRICVLRERAAHGNVTKIWNGFQSFSSMNSLIIIGTIIQYYHTMYF